MAQLPNRDTHFAEWYQEVIYRSELVDQSPVRGSMVIRPYGYALWEHIKAVLDDSIKGLSVENTAFPLLIPESFMKREAEHVEGFAPELAVVTHAGGKELEEPLVIRPTSETIVHYMFSRWIHSWRDLPLKVNQWANVVRWELRTRPFLRTTEIFWQEGHTAHETEQEAEEFALKVLDEYVRLAHDYLAVPVLTGLKTEQEKFPGAKKTMTFEAVMPDGKALQMGTSHLLSQNFAHSFDINFQDRDGKNAVPHLTSWGTTTRLIGAAVMVHGDEKGLVLPPKVAPIQVVIIPIFKQDSDEKGIMQAVSTLKDTLQQSNIRVTVDDSKHKTPGNKFYYWELKGVPLRIEIGPRDIAKNSCMVTNRRDGSKLSIPLDQCDKQISDLLQQIQSDLFAHAQQRLKNLWHHAANIADFGKKIQKEGGLYQSGWCGSKACEDALKQYQATIRCIWHEVKQASCYACDKKSPADVLIAKAY